MRSVVGAVLAALVVAGGASSVLAKELAFCAAAGPEGFDPARYVTPATFDASAETLYNRLVEFRPGTAELVPALAETWEASEDGLTWTFHLREGVKFHTRPYFAPSRDLAADDVVFSLARQFDPKNAYYDYAGGQWPFYAGMALDRLVKSVRKVDSGTVAITLAEPSASLPAMLAMPFASILSKEYADSLADNGTRELIDSQPIGTGPYRFVSYVPDASIGYERNPDYWRAPPAVDVLTFAITPDPADRVAALKAGDCAVIAEVDPAALRSVAADETLAIAEADRLDVAFLAFNTTQPPFDDPRVRRALGLAIDKQAIVNAVYGGAAAVADSLVPPTMWSYVAPAAATGENVAEAERLLAEAGVSGLSFPLLTARIARPYNPDPLTVAGMIAADLAKVGVTAEVVAPELLGDFLRQSSDPERDGAVLIGWTSDNGDPDNFLGLLLSCHAVGSANRAQWCDETYTGLVDAARAATDPAARAALYADAQRIAADLAPVTPIAHTVVSVPIAGDVTGFVASPFGQYNFESVDIAR